MFDQKQFENLAKQLFNALPESMQAAETQLQQKFKEILNTTFNKMDLVTREEFDVQIKVLARTRQKVEALEEQVARLMKQ